MPKPLDFDSIDKTTSAVMFFSGRGSRDLRSLRALAVIFLESPLSSLPYPDSSCLKKKTIVHQDARITDWCSTIMTFEERRDKRQWVSFLIAGVILRPLIGNERG
jgi:hypothetical protein